MNTLTNDKLFQLLCRVKTRPALLFGVKSLMALENYINGYLYACEEDCFTVCWYKAFIDYAAKVLEVKDEFFSLSTIIKSKGYDDSDGTDYFMELLEQFAVKNGNVAEFQTNTTNLRNGEIRIFRIDAIKTTDFVAKYVREHCEELFSVPAGCEQYALVFQWERDNTLTCALCSDNATVAKISHDNAEMSEKIKRLPVFQSAERIQCTSFTTTQSGDVR